MLGCSFFLVQLLNCRCFPSFSSEWLIFSSFESLLSFPGCTFFLSGVLLVLVFCSCSCWARSFVIVVVAWLFCSPNCSQFWGRGGNPLVHVKISSSSSSSCPRFGSSPTTSSSSSSLAVASGKSFLSLESSLFLILNSCSFLSLAQDDFCQWSPPVGAAAGGTDRLCVSAGALPSALLPCSRHLLLLSAAGSPLFYRLL